MSVLKDGFWRDRERKESLEDEISKMRPENRELQATVDDLAARLAAAEAEVARLRNLHERIAKVLAPQPCRTHLELMLDVDAALDLSRAALTEPKP
jgi:predicted  nucleic acid-binding Zn-ribbon protein